MRKGRIFLNKLGKLKKGKEEGVTLISVLIMVIIIFIIASIVVTGGISLINHSKENSIEEERAAVKAAVNRVAVKNATYGVLTPATTETYGKPVNETIYSGEGYDLGDWFLLEKEDLEKIGVHYVEGPYVVNFVENQVYAMNEFKEYVAENGTEIIDENSNQPKYTVQFHPDDESAVTGSMKSQTFIIGKEQALRNNTYSKDGYHFAGWNTAIDGNGTTYSNRQKVKDLTVEDGGTVHLYTMWEKNAYKIRFVANGGTGTMEEQELKYNEEAALTGNEFERFGYTFLGWNTAANGSGTTYTDGQTVKNIAQQNNYTVNLYAQWKGSTYTIHYDANTGTGNMPDQEMEAGVAANLKPNAFTKTGYDFVEWNTKADGTGRAYANEVMVGNLVTSGTITLYAQWTEHIFKIQYDGNTGVGTMETQTLPYFSTDTLKPNAYTKTGYTYVKWNTAANGTGIDFVDQAPISCDVVQDGMIMYAQWKANEYTIKFDANTGTGTMQDEVFTYDIPKNLTANGFTKTGYTFTGWNTQADGSGTPHTEGERIENLLTEGEVTFYAQWEANTYTIKFDGNGNTGGSMADESMTYDAEKALTANGFTKTGYTFAGWATTATGAVVYADKANVNNLTTTLNGIVTLYAKWTANTYTVSFNNNGGTGGQSANVTATYDSAMPTISTTKPTKTGYTFGGWYDTNATTGGNQYYTAGGASARTWNKTADTTLYARWTANTYTVSFNNNGGTGGQSANVTATYDSAMPTISTTKPTKTGYTFGGWYDTNAATGGTQYYTADGASARTWNKTADTTLYARWTANTYTVSFNNNGGTGGQSANVIATYDSAMPTISTTKPTKTGYTFGGWYDTNATTGGTQYYTANGTSARTWNKTEDATLYARWTANKYTVSFNNNGGTGGHSENIMVTYDSDMPTISTTKPTNTGYTFGGWYDTEAATGGTQYYTADGESVRPWNKTEDTTLYARWLANTYTIKFNGNGNTGGSMTDESMTYDTEKALPANGFTKTGYTFAGWATSETGAVVYADKANVNNLTSTDGGTVNLYAKWTANTYTIKFNGNGNTGGSMTDESMTYDTAKTLPANGFTKTGYTFAGWATSETGTVVYADKANVNNLTATNGETVNLYAKWTTNNYTINYYQGNNTTSAGSKLLGSSAHSVDTAKALSSYSTFSSNLPSSTPNSTWNFAGWTTSQTGTTVEYTDGQSVTNLTTTDGGTINLYAVFKRNFTFYSGILKETSSTVEQRYNPYRTTGYITTVTAPKLTAITNWSALGYRTDTTADTAGVTASTTATGSVTPVYNATALTYYGVYSRTLTISYNANGGSGTTTSTTKTVYLNTNATTTSSQTVTLASNNYTNTGYTFDSWALGSASGTKYSAGGSYTANLAYNASTFGKTMYATWNENIYTYTVNYYQGNNTTSAGSKLLGSETHTVGTPKALSSYSTFSSNLPSSKPNSTWSFAGWTTTQTGTTAEYTDGQTVTSLTTEDGGTVNLYAVFKRDITFYSGVSYGSSSTVEQRYNPYRTTGYITTVTAPKLTAISNWSALGYRTDATANSATVTASTTSTGSVAPGYNATALTYYGVYSRTLTISYNANGGSGTTTSTTKTIYLNTSSTTTSSQTVTLAYNNYTNSGYTFDGWALGSASGTKYSSGGSYTANLAYNASTFGKTMYATWSENVYTYTVKYYQGNNTTSAGSKLLGSETHTVGTSKALSSYSTFSSNLPSSKPNSTWSFAGWTTSQAGTTVNYTDGQTVVDLTTVDGGTVSLYAVFKRDIAFYSGVSYGSYSTVEQRYNPYRTTGYITTVTAPKLTAISNWTALGYRNDTSASSATVTASTTSTGSVTPVYNATAITYYGVYNRLLTISYNANGGSGTTTSTTKTIYLNTSSTTTSSQTVTLTYNNFTKTGFDFNGWALGSASGTKYSAGGSYTAGLSYNASTFEKTMYATWTLQEAVFDTGTNVNIKMKKLAGASSATVETFDTNITAVVRSSSEPSSSNKTTNNLVSVSELPIYMWYSSGTIYWWSEDSTPRLNSDASHMFRGLVNLSNISSLQYIDTSICTDISYMFYSAMSITSLSSLSGWNTANITNMMVTFGTNAADMETTGKSFQLTTLAGIQNWNTSKVTNMKGLVRFQVNLTNASALNSWNTSSVTNMGNMFDSCARLTSLNLSNFNTSNVTDMGGMFHNCTSMSSLNISSFNTSKVTEMDHMFNISDDDILGKKYNDSLTSLNLSHFNTSNVTKMAWMFDSLVGLTSLNVSSFNTSKVTDMTGMFAACKGLTSLNVSNFNTSNVTIMREMFSGLNLTSLDLSNFNTSKVTNMEYMFTMSNKLTTIYASSSWSTANVTASTEMFFNCVALRGDVLFNSSYIDKTYAKIYGGYLTCTEEARFDTGTNVNIKMKKLAGISSPDSTTLDTAITAIVKSSTPPTTANATAEHIVSVSNKPIYMWYSSGTMYWHSTDSTPQLNSDASYMFRGLTNLTNISGLQNFDASTCNDMSYMFYSTLSLTSLSNLSSWNTSNVTNMRALFATSNTNMTSSGKTPQLTTLSGIQNWNTTKVTDMAGLLQRQVNLTNASAISSWNTANVTDMLGMFRNCEKLTSINVSSYNTSKVTSMSNMFNSCARLTSINLSNFNTNNVTDMSAMFHNCTSLSSITFGSNFKTSKVTNMSNMFNIADDEPLGKKYNDSLKSLNLSGFDTSNVTTMSYMFESLHGLTSINLGSNFKTSKVTSMGSMFGECQSLTSLNVSGFDTSNVTDMSYMFSKCWSLTTLNVSSFNTSKVTDMSWMFGWCARLTSLNLSNFNTSNVTNMHGMFCNCTSVSSYSLTSFNTSKVTDMSYMFHIGDDEPLGQKRNLALTSLNLSSFNTSNVTDMSWMFDSLEALKSITFGSNFTTSKVTTMNHMFSNDGNLTSLDLSTFNTSNVTDMSGMFNWCGKCTTIYAGSGWSTTKVTSSADMFYNCSVLRGDIAFNSSYTDKTYAKTSGGYLTAK